MTRKPLSGVELNELVAGLNKLARNLWWCWDQEAQDLFQELSPRGWQNLFHNAVAVLREVSEYELRVHLQDTQFAERVRAVLNDFHNYLNDKKTWGHQNAPDLHKNPVAYFSAEFGFHESLPIAAGGLGILAGDHAKSASDLGLGFVGVGLFYREGYFQQAIDANNWQTEYYNPVDPHNVPLEPMLDADGERLVCSVEIGMNAVDFQVWRVNVGRVPVYLLDTNLPGNEQHFRDLTSRVYGGDSTTRIMQEILLGVGGVRLLRALGHEPSTFHMNEGHAAFLTLELIREKIAAGKKVSVRNDRDKSAMHLHHAHAGRGRPRPLHTGLDELRAAKICRATAGSFQGHSGARSREAGRRDGNILHDGAGAETVALRQCRERTARPGQPPHVAVSLSRQEGKRSAHRPHHQRHSPARLDEGHGAAVLAEEIERQ